MARRPEIDGLRAVAVGAVILFHASLNGFEAGYLGVDIFFVISGFLICQIILRELRDGSFSFATFYLRRTRRILPALTVMLVACALAGWLFLPPTELKALSEGLGTTVLFLSNFYYMTQTGYFGPEAETLPLLHTWSLAIEEQYYLLFPLFAVVVYRFARRAFFALIALLCLGSFALGLALQADFPDQVYFFSPARIWQLLLGVLAILGLGRLPARAADAGFALILAGLIVDRGAEGFPTFGAVLVCLGTALYLPAAKPGQGAGRVLALAPFRLVGLVSYSAYLWHQPLFAFAREITQAPLSGGLIAALIGLTLVLASLSYRYIEQPFQNPAFKVSRAHLMWPLAALSTAALFAFAFQGFQNGGYPGRFSPEVQQLALAEQETPKYRRRCGYRGVGATPQHPLAACQFAADSPSQGEVIVIGDSHADAIAETLVAALNTAGFDVYLTTYGGCVPALGLKVQSAPDCAAFMQSAFDYTAQRPDAVSVVIGRWSRYVQGSAFDTLEGLIGPSDDIFVDLAETEGFRPLESRARQSDVAERIVESLSALAQIQNLVLVEPIPEVGFNAQKRVVRALINGESPADTSTPKAAYEARHAALFKALQAATLQTFPTAQVFCPPATRRCLASQGSTPYYRDNNHLNVAGAALLSDALVKALQEGRYRR